MITLVLAGSAAFAWSWDHDEAPTGDTMTIHLCLGDFTSDEAGQIFAAADAWRSGTNEVLRGAEWSFVRGADRADGTCGPGNGFNEVHAEDDQWFSDHDAGGAIATTMNDDVAVSAEVDFVWNTADAGDWSTRKPSGTGAGELSLGMIALHELGHGLGFNHDDAAVAVMNSSYPNGGDLGGRYRPHADDYAGLVANRPHSSTGVNLMLGRFVEEPSDPGDAIEVWDDPTAEWTVCREEVDGDDGPEPIYGALHDTSQTEVRPVVVWTLSSDQRCFDGLEYEVARDEPAMVAGGPTVVHPGVYTFDAVPAGQYTLCAMIDADLAITEVREGDNVVRSEAAVTVQDCR